MPLVSLRTGNLFPRPALEQVTCPPVLRTGYLSLRPVPASCLHNYAGFNDDSDIADYAKAAVERFYKTGIIGGYPDGGFKPKGDATRAEFATMVMRFLEAME